MSGDYFNNAEDYQPLVYVGISRIRISSYFVIEVGEEMVFFYRAGQLKNKEHNHINDVGRHW